MCHLSLSSWWRSLVVKFDTTILGILAEFTSLSAYISSRNYWHSAIVFRVPCACIIDPQPQRTGSMYGIGPYQAGCLFSPATAHILRAHYPGIGRHTWGWWANPTRYSSHKRRWRRSSSARTIASKWGRRIWVSPTREGRKGRRRR